MTGEEMPDDASPTTGAGQTDRRRYRIEGRVQGVGFRWWVRRHAVDLGLCGTVRNLPEGCVVVEAAGRPEALDRLRSLLRMGPPAADVAGIVEEPPSDATLPRDFEIGF